MRDTDRELLSEQLDQLAGIADALDATVDAFDAMRPETIRIAVRELAGQLVHTRGELLPLLDPPATPADDWEPREDDAF